MTYAGQEAQLSMVVFIFSKQPSLADAICWVRVSKFLATNTASLILTFLSKSENEEIKIGKIKHDSETKMVKKRNKLYMYRFYSMKRKVLPFKSSVDIGPAKHFVTKKTTMQLRRNTNIFLEIY